MGQKKRIHRGTAVLTATLLAMGYLASQTAISAVEYNTGTGYVLRDAQGKYLSVAGGTEGEKVLAGFYEADGAAPYNTWYITETDQGITVKSALSEGQYYLTEDGNGGLRISTTPGTFLLDENGALSGFRSGVENPVYAVVVPEAVTNLRNGDLNSDGTVNGMDLAMLRQIAVSGGDFVQNALADLSGDGVVSDADFTLMQQFLLGEDVRFAQPQIPDCTIVPPAEDSITTEPVVTEISIGAKDSNDYLEVLDGHSVHTVKKDGYYSVSYNFNGKWYGNYLADDDFTIIETDGCDDVKDSIVFAKFSAGEIISYSNIYSDSDYYIGYSEDGKELNALIKITPEVLPEVEDTCSVEIESTLTKESSTSAVFSFNVYCTEEDVTLTEMTLRRDDEYGQIFFDVDSVYGETSHKFEYEFTENGKYYLNAMASDGSYRWVELTVGCIDNSLQVEDEFVDSTAPTLKIETSDVTGLSAGDSYEITVKADEVCNIKIANQAFENVHEATAYVLMNDVYEIFAVDSWGNSTTETVKVTAFGDGSMPGDNVDNTPENENPIDPGNKDDFWGNAMNNE